MSMYNAVCTVQYRTVHIINSHAVLHEHDIMHRGRARHVAEIKIIKFKCFNYNENLIRIMLQFYFDDKIRISMSAKLVLVHMYVNSCMKRAKYYWHLHYQMGFIFFDYIS